jgi:hypothetical protein
MKASEVFAIFLFVSLFIFMAVIVMAGPSNAPRRSIVNTQTPTSSPVNTQTIDTVTQKAVEKGFAKGVQSIAIGIGEEHQRLCAAETDPLVRKLMEDDCKKVGEHLRELKALEIR